ncbi:hypothetical protein [Plebeiibacterium marinum]|uniref:Uncharacterized protein n=1 Tax=Plebeiibacterium marinum TaxID=2992111 RepID=A0AAE3SLI0_9BACT|nr:hypothetical protein [Plebeiobacterium marinum]MCW3807905.1 hypothetical protein [Plebeiobacterium marinum]
MENTPIQPKKRTLIDYYKLPKDLQEQLKLVYSQGFNEDLIVYKDASGKQISALRFETDTIVYMVKMSIDQAYKIMDDDSDFNDDYELKSSVKEDYMDKHSDADYLFDS